MELASLYHSGAYNFEMAPRQTILAVCNIYVPVHPAQVGNEHLYG